jgi:excisionase family DNA binding protein
MNRGHQLLSVKEAAERLNISVFTLRGWISQRRVRFVKLGRRTMFLPTDLEDLINGSVIEPRPRREAQ